MSTPERKREIASKLEAAALKLRREAEQKSKKQQPVSPPVDPPTIGTDGKIVKKRWEKRWNQFTIASHPDKKADDDE